MVSTAYLLIAQRRILAWRARHAVCPREDAPPARPRETRGNSPGTAGAKPLRTEVITMSRLFAAGFVALAVASLPIVANAQEGDAISVQNAQFTDKIESHKPIGDASTLKSGQVVTYWVEVNNPNEAQPITLVWKLDGVEAGKQTLDVGHAPHWRTWGSFPSRKAHAIEVHVLDKDGHELRADTLNL
jgi:hypothetical protein